MSPYASLVIRVFVLFAQGRSDEEIAEMEGLEVDLVAALRIQYARSYARSVPASAKGRPS